MNRSGSRIFYATLFFLLATVILLVLILNTQSSTIPLMGIVATLDSFLRTIFLQSVWAVPAYLFYCGFLALYIDDKHQYQALYPFTAIPFATIIGFLHLQTGPSETALYRWIAEKIGVQSGSMIVLFVFILEVILFFVWALNWLGRGSSNHSANYVLQEQKTISGGLGSQKNSLTEEIAQEKRMQKEATRKRVEVGSDDDYQFSELTLSFPEIPDLPVLSTVKSSTFVEEAIEEPARTLDDVDLTDEQPEGVPLVPKARVQTRPIQIHGKLHEIKLEAPTPESIKIGKHVIPKIPSENSGFENSKQPSIAGRLTKIQTSIDDNANIPSRELLSTGFRALGYIYPSEDVLDTYPDISIDIDDVTRISGEVLMKTLREFKIEADLTGIQKGPVVTMYEILPAPGIRVQAITNLADNIALQLAASRVRIVAPIPGKQAIGIEVPNKIRSIVSFREMLAEVDKRSNYEIPIVLGKDITGESQVIDLAKTPHLLIAGATGSGKSVCVNALISSILYRRSPKDVRLLLVDPKIVELKLYNDIPHLLTPVITDSKKAIKVLQYCIHEMERRYELLDHLNVRDIKTYNKRIKEKAFAQEKLPYIVLVIDEFADLMTTAGKEMETYLARLAAMARAVGIHLVLATQRPSTNVITGIIKANIPSRIAFMVTSNTDSRIILDQSGAEKLLGRGDMLFSSSWDPSLARIQGAFLSDEEVERIVEEVKHNGEPDYLDEEIFWDDEDVEEGGVSLETTGDPLMDEALKIVYGRNSASASYLQRRLKIGYNRAARLIEEMEDRGIVGPARGSQPREILRMIEIDH